MIVLDSHNSVVTRVGFSISILSTIYREGSAERRPLPHPCTRTNYRDDPPDSLHTIGPDEVRKSTKTKRRTLHLFSVFHLVGVHQHSLCVLPQDRSSHNTLRSR